MLPVLNSKCSPATLNCPPPSFRCVQRGLAEGVPDGAEKNTGRHPHICCTSSYAELSRLGKGGFQRSPGTVNGVFPFSKTLKRYRRLPQGPRRKLSPQGLRCLCCVSLCRQISSSAFSSPKLPKSHGLYLSPKKLVGRVPGYFVAGGRPPGAVAVSPVHGQAPPTHLGTRWAALALSE